MKIPKLLLTIAAFAAGITIASAQPALVYPLLNGGTTVIPAMSTNTVYFNGATNFANQAGVVTNLLMNVSEFDEAALTLSETATAGATNAPAGLRVYRSYDFGNVYETNPGFTFSTTPAAPGGNTFYTNAPLDLHGITTLEFVPFNATGGAFTNVLLEINLKSPKFGAVPATR
ncbi:MAG: hypothetical protein ACLP2Y_08910 [Limisphaerales bacterium]